MILNIEVKSGQGLNALKKAASQTNIHQNIFKKIFGAHLSEEWRFVKTAFTPNLLLKKISDSQPCEYCKKFMITDIQTLDDWIENLRYPDNIFKEEDYKSEYENLLVGIIGYSSLRQTDTLNQKIVNPQEFNQATKNKVTASDTFNDITIKNKIGEAENLSKSEYMCYMLTPEQLMAVKDPSSHIIIDGDYGSGKTYVLKERAKLFAKKYPNEDIVYINLTIDLSCDVPEFNIMDMIARNNFKDYNNVFVKTYKDLICHDHVRGNKLSQRGKCGMYLKHFLENSKYDHVFLDEMLPFEKDYSSLFSFIDLFSTAKTYCVTMKLDPSINNKISKWIEQMEDRFNAKTIIFRRNMRNSGTIVNFSTWFDFDWNPNISVSFSLLDLDITGPECYHYHNIHRFNIDLLVIASVMKYFQQQSESVLVLTDNENDQISTQNLYKTLQKYFSRNRNVVCLPRNTYNDDNEKQMRQVEEYLEKPEGIIVTDITEFNGAQARNIIIVTNDRLIKFLTNNVRNMIMRTMSVAIIIHTRIIEKSLPGIVSDKSLHEYVDPEHMGQLSCNNEEEKHRRFCTWQIKQELFSILNNP